MNKVIVVGGGAAGLMAGGTASMNGSEVLILEKNPRTARKILVTGKGRCNVTNACDNDTFIKNVSKNSRFLYSAINNFSTEDTMEFFENLGVPLKVERGNRVFPVSEKAMDIADALYNFAVSQGCQIIQQTVTELIVSDGKVSGVKTSDGLSYYADSVIISTGGKSYPRTGSTGDGYFLARSVGHTVTDILPSLIPLVSDDEHPKELQGLSLKNVSLTLYEDNKEIFNDFGEMLFTHFGVSGPLVLSSSAHIKKWNKARYYISIDLKPALSYEELDKRLIREFDKFANKDIHNSLSELLPHKLIPVILKIWGIDSFKKCNIITKEERKKLSEILKNFRVSIKEPRPIEEAIITSGGVSVREISPKTMESKLINGLFFAGEVIDVDAYTGGFNLQIAFSTARLAGTYA